MVWCPKIHPFHTHDFTSSPKISQRKVDSQLWSPNTPINHLIEINRNEITPPKSTLFYITPNKLQPLPTNHPLHTITSTNLKAWKNTHKLVWRKESLCLYFQAKPLGSRPKCLKTDISELNYVIIIFLYLFTICSVEREAWLLALRRPPIHE